jgi:hypothetical protein
MKSHHEIDCDKSKVLHSSFDKTLKVDVIRMITDKDNKDKMR